MLDVLNMPIAYWIEFYLFTYLRMILYKEKCQLKFYYVKIRLLS